MWIAQMDSICINKKTNANKLIPYVKLITKITGIAQAVIKGTQHQAQLVFWGGRYKYPIAIQLLLMGDVLNV